MQLKVNSELNVDSHTAVPVFFPKCRAEFEGQKVSDSRNRGLLVSLRLSMGGAKVGPASPDVL